MITIHSQGNFSQKAPNHELVFLARVRPLDFRDFTRESQPSIASTISAFGSRARPRICVSVASHERGGRPYRSARYLARLAFCPRTARASATLTSHSSKQGVGRFISPLRIEAGDAQSNLPALDADVSFPNAKPAFMQESPNDIRSTQLPVFEVVD